MRANERERERTTEREKQRKPGRMDQRRSPVHSAIALQTLISEGAPTLGGWGRDEREREREQGTRARKDRGPSPVDSLRADPDPALGGWGRCKEERERSQSRWFRKCSDARTTHRSVGQDSRRAVLDDAGTALRPPAWGRFVQSVRGTCCSLSLSLFAHSSARGPSHGSRWGRWVGCPAPVVQARAPSASLREPSSREAFLPPWIMRISSTSSPYCCRPTCHGARHHRRSLSGAGPRGSSLKTTPG